MRQTGNNAPRHGNGDFRRLLTGKVFHPVSPKHLHVINEYFVNGYSQKKALLSAGYSKTTANLRHSTVFKRPDVVAEIQRRMDGLNQKYDVDADWVIRQFVKIAMSSVGDIMEINEETGEAILDLRRLDDASRSAISEYTVETYQEGRGRAAVEVKKHRIKFHDKLAALNALGRVHGIFNDKSTVTHELSIVDALQAGRARVAKVIEVDFEEIEDD